MKRLNQTIGLMGCGNMGSAILAGLLRKRLVRPNQVFVYDPIISKARSISKEFRLQSVQSNLELARRSQIMILAFKPQDLHLATGEMRPVLRSNQIVISILAGTPVSKLYRAFGGRTTLVRAMPNLGAQVGAGITVLVGTSRAAVKIAKAIFSCCGKTIELPEKCFDWVTAVSGSGPAYFFLMMELLAKAARRGGISEKSAKLLATQTALGAAQLAAVSSHSPEALRKMVTSKKGTTEAALKVLFKGQFPNLFSHALAQAVRRAKELSQN
ncbi:MAG: pyrroline-5-carboxylate reductase [Candidatus Omnitrophica bacterium]|nr:pyrroline-5-carboxylate reductase [Candidatus Omnitrophota bacterium]